MSYEDNKKWRLENPDKRNTGKKRNYANRRFGNPRPWTKLEEELLLKYEALPDVEIATLMKRSVQAIQIKRCRLKNS